ncbi:hypothetical protein ACVWZM_002992 [Bradyrhizobium sp. USDA 4501]
MTVLTTEHPLIWLTKHFFFGTLLRLVSWKHAGAG